METRYKQNQDLAELIAAENDTPLKHSRGGADGDPYNQTYYIGDCAALARIYAKHGPTAASERLALRLIMRQLGMPNHGAQIKYFDDAP